MFDIVGDIHGHARELRALLEKMGYRAVGACYRHDTRQVIFVGDFIDRGPEIAETLSIVKAMHDSGTALAVMGNHEFNALAYHTPHPARPEQFLRPHIAKNIKQLAETHRQLSSRELDVYLDWFRTLPMFLELDGLRVVHACWDQNQINLIESHVQSHGGITDEFMTEATEPSAPLFEAVDNVLKGKNAKLPKGLSYLDQEGHPRKRVRIQWYRNPQLESYRDYSLSDGYAIPDTRIPNEFLPELAPYEPSEVPVIVGHYWLQREVPKRLAPNVACVDYSIAKRGKLAAYRWSGERELLNENFTTIPYLER